MHSPSEAHRANTRCQRVVVACEIQAMRLERAGQREHATELRRAVKDALADQPRTGRRWWWLVAILGATAWSGVAALVVWLLGRT